MANSDDASTIAKLQEPVAAVQPGESEPFQSQSINPENPPWGIGGALLVWFLSVCLVVFVPLIFLGPYVAMQGFNFRDPEQIRALAEFVVTDRTAVVLQLIAILPIHLLSLFLIWALVTRFGRRPFLAALGWSWPQRFGMWSAIGLAVVLVLVAAVITQLLGSGKPTPFEQMIKTSLAARYLISFFAVATAPVVEEFIYRGMLYAPLQRVVGVKAAVAIVLLLFTIVHVPQYQSNLGVIAAIGLLSLVLTVLRAYTGRILPCVVVHLVFNAIQAALLILEPYIERFMPAPEPVAPPASILLSLLGVVF